MPNGELKTIPLESIVANTPLIYFLKEYRFSVSWGNENFAYIAGFESAKEIVGKTDMIFLGLNFQQIFI